jgi:hypothetical protein
MRARFGAALGVRSPWVVGKVVGRIENRWSGGAGQRRTSLEAAASGLGAGQRAANLRRRGTDTASRESYIAREAITGADQRRGLTVLAGGRTAAPRTNRTVTPRRGNGSQNFMTAEPRVRKNNNKIVEMNGIDPSAF